MKNPSQSLVNFSEGKLLSSSISVFDSWPDGYCDVYDGEGGFSSDGGGRIRSHKQGICKSSVVEIPVLLPSDPFKTDLLPLDPFEMCDGEATPEIVGTSSYEHSLRIKDQFEEDDALFPGFNWLCRGAIMFVPDTDFEELGESCKELPLKYTNKKLKAIDDHEGISENIHESDSVAGSWGWGDTACHYEGMSSFAEHVSHGSAQGGIVDMLPADPFGMEFMGRVRFMSDAGNMDADGSRNNFPFDRVLMTSDIGELVNLGREFDAASSSTRVYEGQKHDECSCVHEMGEPNYAMFLALNYMGVKDLLSMEKVCKSLNDAVKNNPSLWKNIHVDTPLNGVLTDEALMQLTSRASEQLESLTLSGCYKITDTAIRKVINNNPKLTKLSTPGCLNLSIEGILTTLKSAEVLSIKQLRLGGLTGITNKQLEELQVLLSANLKSGKSAANKPFYYHNHRQSYLLSVDDDRAIDIEKCQQCGKVRLVYDCPADSCQKKSTLQACKACILCISRCTGCGSCLEERDYVETFVLDVICSQCWCKRFGRSEKETQECLPVF